MKRLWLWLFREWVTEVRREGLIYGRHRAIDEFRALTWGQDIESGVGVDVQSIWKFAVLQITSGVVK